MNQIGNVNCFQKILRLIIAAALLLSSGPASAAAIPLQGVALLLDTYIRNAARMETSGFGLPLFLESYEQDDRVHVDVYGLIEFRFNRVVNALKVPANWCEIVSLHPNVKACTYSEKPGEEILTFYIGKKEYQPPEDSRPVIYHFRNIVQQKAYLDIILTAYAGPFGTKDHTMRFEAVPLGEKTFVHVRYEYRDSLALRLAGKAYFATLGRSRVGFTITGKDENDKPVYIGGPRGALERNAVRYYLAIQSFMMATSSPEKVHLSMITGRWYELTTRYRRQLFDLERNDYLAYKEAEHKNQTALQRLIGNAFK